MSDYQTHVFTSTYTADVSGVCSAMYELGGMTVLHDPSGCNSTYSTHDEPRWFDGKSLMFVSGLDEMTAVLGDDSVLVNDVRDAVRDLKPRFVTLCGGSIPHIIAFDFKGTAHLIEKATGVPVLPVATDGLQSYVNGVGRALTEFVKRFADPAEQEEGRKALSVNLLGVTPLDFSVNGNVEALRETFEEAGIPVNCCAAMGEDFDGLAGIYRGSVNVVVSSAGRRTARLMERTAGIPRVEGLPIGPEMSKRVLQAVRDAFEDGQSRILREMPEYEADAAPEFSVLTPESLPDFGCGFGSIGGDAWGAVGGEEVEIPDGQIVILGEEIYAHSLAMAINALPEACRGGLRAYAVFPDVDEGMPEEILIPIVRGAAVLIADPLYRVVMKPGQDTRVIEMPHEAYSGRIYRGKMPVFCGPGFDIEKMMK